MDTKLAGAFAQICRTWRHAAAYSNEISEGVLRVARLDFTTIELSSRRSFSTRYCTCKVIRERYITSDCDQPLVHVWSQRMHWLHSTQLSKPIMPKRGVGFDSCSLSNSLFEIQIGFYGNPHSRTRAFGWEAESATEKAREKVASLINASSTEIVFTSGVTESNNLAIK